MNIDDARKRHEFLVRYETPSGGSSTVSVFANNTKEANKRYQETYGHRGPVRKIFRCVAEMETKVVKTLKVLPSR